MMLMKYVCALAAFATTAFAQGIVIAFPTAGTDVKAGEPFIVDVARPNTLTPSQELSVAIGVLSCQSINNGDCAAIDMSERFGYVMYGGPYTPSLQAPPPPLYIDYYQNFSLTIPEGFPTGVASLNVAHFSLVGAGPYPFLEIRNITINVV